MENSESKNTFTIMPMSQRVNLKPGDVYEGSISIVNPADATSDFNYKVTVTPYSVKDGDYKADLATQNNRSEMVKWITIEEPTGTVAPNNVKKINYKITVPQDAAGGGQYATLSVGSNNEVKADKGMSIQNVFEMASLIYANVSGEIKHEGAILENKIPGFSTVVPVSVSAKISNTGNVHEDATIVIKASNFFTGEVILPTEDNDGEYNELIMPETERDITRNIDNLPMLGAVKVEQTIYYLGQSSAIEQVVLICPIWFLLLVIATIAAIVAAIVGIVKKHKKKNHLN